MKSYFFFAFGAFFAFQGTSLSSNSTIGLITKVQSEIPSFNGETEIETQREELHIILSNVNFCNNSDQCVEAIRLEAIANNSCSLSNLHQWDWEVFIFGNRSNSVKNQDSLLTGSSLSINHIWPLTPNAGPAHLLRISVKDQCGNTTVKEFDFRIRDCVKPKANCRNGLTIYLNPSTCMATLNAGIINSGSYDNCTSSADLVYHLVRTQYDDFQISAVDSFIHIDADEVGTVNVRMWVYDSFGNKDYCDVDLLVHNFPGTECCDFSTGAALSGRVTSQAQGGIANVHVVSGSTLLATTDDDGQYETRDPLPWNTNLVIRAEKEDNANNGVTTLDILLIQRHILGVEMLRGPLKFIAADVNRSNSITAADLVEIRKVILGKSDMFTNNTSWRFFAADWDIIDSLDVPHNTLREFVEINYTGESIVDVDFVGVKIGDINGSARTSRNTLSVSSNRNSSFKLMVNDLKLQSDQEYSIPIKANNLSNCLGFQFTLQFDPKVLQFLGIEQGIAKMQDEHFGYTKLDEGLIAVSWNTPYPINGFDDNALFSLIFAVNSDAILSDVLELNSKIANALIVSTAMEESVLTLEFTAVDSTPEIGAFELFQNTPNPFLNETSIKFSLPQSMFAKIAIFDGNGRVVYQIQGNFKEGVNEVGLDRSVLSQKGMYYYQLESGQFRGTKKMICLD
jgi:hypothetical protein